MIKNKSELNYKQSKNDTKCKIDFWRGLRDFEELQRSKEVVRVNAAKHLLISRRTTQVVPSVFGRSPTRPTTQVITRSAP